MEYIKLFIDFMLHLDVYLNMVIQNYGLWTYALLFIILFCETGLVVAPFLPGDSLIFAAGTFAALGALNPIVLFGLLSAASILGDTVNYGIGRALGSQLYQREKMWFIKREHLERTQAFYNNHGGKTIVLARFIPIVRTFAPFVAGIGNMKYLYFVAYNVFGGLLWVGTFLSLGYFFGNLTFVKDNFSLALLAIVFISALPGLLGIKQGKNKAKPETI